MTGRRWVGRHVLRIVLYARSVNIICLSGLWMHPSFWLSYHRAFWYEIGTNWSIRIYGNTIYCTYFVSEVNTIFMGWKFTSCWISHDEAPLCDYAQNSIKTLRKSELRKSIADTPLIVSIVSRAPSLSYSFYSYVPINIDSVIFLSVAIAERAAK